MPFSHFIQYSHHIQRILCTIISYWKSPSRMCRRRPRDDGHCRRLLSSWPSFSADALGSIRRICSSRRGEYGCFSVRAAKEENLVVLCTKPPCPRVARVCLLLFAPFSRPCLLECTCLQRLSSCLHCSRERGSVVE